MVNDASQYALYTHTTLILLYPPISNQKIRKNKMDNEIYRQALLDAKAVRASAIANAKASLNEAFEPKIQEVLRLKLSEELEDELEEAQEEVEESLQTEEQEEVEESASELEESELDEILRELESLSEESEEEIEEGKEEMEEAKEEIEEGYEEEMEEAEETEEEEEEEEEGAEEEVEDEENVNDETEVVELTVGDLKRVLQDLIAAGEMPQDMETGDEMGEPDGEVEDDALSLDEILSELQEEEEEEIEEAKEHDEKKPMKKEGKSASISGNGFGKGSSEAPKTGATSWKTVGHLKEAKKQLEEANKTIKILSEKMSEINLLNAKLLYMNKIFKAKALTESEKIKVVNAFDRTTSVKEVENTYKTLSESFTNKKSQIKESVGFASKPAGVASKNPIVDTDPTANRWKELVFGKK